MNERSVIDPVDFALLETLLWRPVEGYFLLNRHLDRLERSAHHFGFRVDIRHVADVLAGSVAAGMTEPQRVRLLVSPAGSCEVTRQPLPFGAPRVLRAALARHTVNPDDPFLHHKTTRRRVYETAKADFPNADDVILHNDRGEVTESTIANVVVVRNGKKFTPPLRCGLLAGTYRAELIARGELGEDVITVKELRNSSQFFLINSVRESMAVALIGG